jgi:DNA/RNA endonuclease YhcR with UshA esterase domain
MMNHIAAAAVVVLLPLLPTTPVQAATYTDSQAASHVGETATVEGVATATHVSTKGTEFINFGDRYPNEDFTAVIFAENAPQIDVSEYPGKKLDVTGKIQLYQGKPEIIVRSPDQLRVAK